MGKCIYCKQPAGFLKNKHPACLEQHKAEEQRKREETARQENLRTQIIVLVASFPVSTTSLEDMGSQIKGLAAQAAVDESELHNLALKGWKAALDKALDDRLLSEDEEKRLMALKERFALSQQEIESGGAFARVVKAAAIRDVLDGKIPQRFTLDSPLPINLQKGEQVVWAFPQVEYLEDRTKREYVGGSRGVSVRVARGLYCRVGAFKGHTVSRTERVSLGRGFLAVTNKHLYFAGEGKSFRVPYAKIVSFEPFSDGIGFTRDAATAKPQIFIMDDGWFIYNLVTNLARL